MPKFSEVGEMLKKRYSHFAVQVNIIFLYCHSTIGGRWYMDKRVGIHRRPTAPNQPSTIT